MRTVTVPQWKSKGALCWVEQSFYSTVCQVPAEVCQALIEHFEDNPEEEALMVGQRGSSRAVSTEALMTVFHPQDAENLDPKMVRAQCIVPLHEIRTH